MLRDIHAHSIDSTVKGPTTETQHLTNVLVATAPCAGYPEQLCLCSRPRPATSLGTLPTQALGTRASSGWKFPPVSPLDCEPLENRSRV